MLDKLTITAVSERLVRELGGIGFSLVQARQPKLAININDQTKVFLYPGVSRDGARIRVDPVIGVINVHLRDRLLASDPKRWRGKTRVCHAYLGILASWNVLYLETTDQLDGAVDTIVESVTGIGLPRMSAFDTLDKVKDLLRDPRAPHFPQPRVAVLFQKDKLAVLQEH